ncbi:MAG: sugar phosphate nucleotidyltransferase [Ignavibacteria bacterium]|nr:sugar phosphate nucleotidyltransferase [Ignavibacteria bacterium]
MKIVVPMAGLGSRFSSKGINIPKPFYAIFNKPIYCWALESIKGISASEIIFIAQSSHKEYFNLDDITPVSKDTKLNFIFIDEITEGQLCTVLKAKDSLDTDEDLLVISSDTIVSSDIKNHIQNKRDDVRGIISVIEAEGGNWSFAKTDKDGNVIEVAEKKRISDLASTGIYYFSGCKEFLHYAGNVISNKIKEKNEYYVIPLYRQYINDNKIIKTSRAEKMWDLGTPDKVELFIKSHKLD